MTALMTALKCPWETGDLATALMTLGVVYSAEFLTSDQFAEFLAWTTPLTPTTPGRIRTVAEQWQADIDFDSLDRVGAITAPALALTGEHDVITPPRHGRAVAERIPGATFELMTGNRGESRSDVRAHRRLPPDGADVLRAAPARVAVVNPSRRPHRPFHHPSRRVHSGPAPEAAPAAVRATHPEGEEQVAAAAVRARPA